MQSISDEIKQLENKVIDIKKRRMSNNSEKILLDIINNFRYATNKIKKNIELLDKAEEEMHAAFQFNHVIVNIDLQKAIQEAEEKVLAFLEEEFPEPDDIA